MPIFHYLAEELKDEPLFSDEEDCTIDETDEFGEGAIYNEFSSEKTKDLLTTKQISEMELHPSQNQSESLESSQYDPYACFTREDEGEALRIAETIDPELYKINHRLQITTGSTKNADYIKAVMLLVTCRLRILSLNFYQELAMTKLHEDGYDQPNSAYDAWLLVNGFRREQFDVQEMLKIYPGVERDLDAIQKDLDENSSSQVSFKQTFSHSESL